MVPRSFSFLATHAHSCLSCVFLFSSLVHLLSLFCARCSGVKDAHAQQSLLCARSHRYFVHLCPLLLYAHVDIISIVDFCAAGIECGLLLYSLSGLWKIQKNLLRLPRYISTAISTVQREICTSMTKGLTIIFFLKIFSNKQGKKYKFWWVYTWYW